MEDTETSDIGALSLYDICRLGQVSDSGKVFRKKLNGMIKDEIINRGLPEGYKISVNPSSNSEVYVGLKKEIGEKKLAVMVLNFNVNLKAEKESTIESLIESPAEYMVRMYGWGMGLDHSGFDLGSTKDRKKFDNFQEALDYLKTLDDTAETLVSFPIWQIHFEDAVREAKEKLEKDAQDFLYELRSHVTCDDRGRRRTATRHTRKLVDKIGRWGNFCLDMEMPTFSFKIKGKFVDRLKNDFDIKLDKKGISFGIGYPGGYGDQYHALGGEIKERAVEEIEKLLNKRHDSSGRGIITVPYSLLEGLEFEKNTRGHSFSQKQEVSGFYY